MPPQARKRPSEVSAPPPAKAAAVAQKRLAKAKAPPAVKELFEKLRAIESAVDGYGAAADEASAEAAAIVEQLGLQGHASRLVTKCGRHHWDGRSVSATIKRSLFFGEFLYAKWEFELLGEAACMGAGLWLMRDFEEPPLPNEFLATIGLDPDDFDTFPTDVE